MTRLPGTLLTLLGLLPLEPPVDIGRDEAAGRGPAGAAKGDLRPRPARTCSPARSTRCCEWIADLFDEVAVRAPGRQLGTALIIVGLIALIIVVVFWRAGVLRTTRAAAGAVFDAEQARTAKQYRAEAERAAAAGEYAAAVRSRFRACAAELAERTDPRRPGRPDRARGRRRRERGRAGTARTAAPRRPHGVQRGCLRQPSGRAAAVRGGDGRGRGRPDRLDPFPGGRGRAEYAVSIRSPAEVWRSVRTPVLVTGGLLAAIAVLVLITTAPDQRAVQPGLHRPGRRQGARRTAGQPQRPVVAAPTDIDRRRPRQGPDGPCWSRRAARSASGAGAQIDEAGWSHVVLVRPPDRALGVLAPGVEYAGSLSRGQPDRGLRDRRPLSRPVPRPSRAPATRRRQDADRCYGDGIHAGVVRLRRRDERIVDVVGTPASFTNEHLADDGNAALALNLLGTHGELVWFLPRFEDTFSDAENGDEQPVIPPWVRYVAWMTGARRTDLRALARPPARARRTRGAAGDRARGRDHRGPGQAVPAFPSPRPGRRRTPRVGAGPAAAGARHRPAGRTGGRRQRRRRPTARDPAVLHALLYGGPPYDDAGLLALSRELDALTQEVRRP